MKNHSTISMLTIALFFGFPLSTAEADVVQSPMSKNQNECVILLHGLARSKSSLSKLAGALDEAGYQVINLDYPSRKQSIESLANIYITKAVAQCRLKGAQKIHFVTHSMGGILVRYYLAVHPLRELGRVVMLSPPNKGSEIVDELGSIPGFFALNGPAGMQLSTDDSSMPNSLGPVNYPVGIITGNKSINLFLSMLIPGQDDGKVSIARAKLDGMTDFLVVPHSHPLIMSSNEVIKQTKYFLQQGRFEKTL